MKVHSLLIGIDYKDSVRPLSYAVQDAKHLHRLCKSSYTGDSILLTDSEATADNIRAKLNELYRSAQGDSDSVILIHFSGHGTRVPYPCLVTHGWRNTPIDNTNSFSLEELRSLLNTFRGPNIVLFLDACYSGNMAGLRDSDGGEDIVSRSIPVYGPVLDSVPTPHSYFNALNPGKIVLTASSEDEAAIELHDLRHGLFSKYLIEALSGAIEPDSDGLISLIDISNHVCSRVPEHAREIGAARAKQIDQHPTYYIHGHREFKLPVLYDVVPRSLLNFPQAFAPLTIIVGDRRELNPKTPGDIFARSSSTADLRWIMGLKLPEDVEILSDKVFINSTDDQLKRQLGDKNLLIIGSPTANHAARLANESALFWFNIAEYTRWQANRIREELRSLETDRAQLKDYVKANEDDLSQYLAELVGDGFIDPTRGSLKRGFHREDLTDYGSITICRHPVTDSMDRLAILVAGAGLPVTMQGIKILSKPKQWFGQHQFGGIFKVEMNNTHWSTKMETAFTRWSTQPYSLEKLCHRLEEIKESETHLKMIQREAADIQRKLDLLQTLAQEAENTATTQ